MACSRRTRRPSRSRICWARRARRFRPERIDAQFAYVGGGFGGRDHTPFPLYVALAAMFFPGRPVRLAHDRYQQFQAGIKRHAFKMQSRIGVDRASGKIQAFAADHVLDGGGLANYSPNVAMVGATAAIGIYDIPKVDVTTVALHSRGVTAGSMRGYGTLQTMTALEVLVDEVATALPLDPIEFRRRNALKPGGRTMTGNPYSVSVRTTEILDKLEKHPIWQQRAQQKIAARRKACSSAPASPASPRITAPAPIARWGASRSRRRAGSRSIAIMSRWATASARRWPTAWRCISARSPTKSRWRGSTAIDVLGLVTSGDPYTMDQKTQDAAETQSALGAGDQLRDQRLDRRACRNAGGRRGGARDFPFRPVAGGTRAVGHRAERPARKALVEGSWKDGQLILSGLVAAGAAGDRREGACAQCRDRCDGARLLALGLVAGALSRSAARLYAPRSTRWRSAGAAANSSGSTASSVKFPPTDNNRIGTAFTSMCGTLVRVEIERATGALRIAKAYSVFECGQALVPEVVVGQAQGGFAMGVGYALLETLPPYEGGPGNGQWNLGQYVIARGSDLPLHDLEIEVLPPLSPKEPPKGMAEVVMIPVVPALLNAIFDATGHRFQSLPVTQAMLKGALA